MHLPGKLQSFGTFLLQAFLCAGVLFAQADRATVTGHVSDSTGALISGVNVIVKDANTGATFTSLTNAAGVYSITGLPIGDYSVQMSHKGFKDSKSSVHLVATQVQALDVSMEIGSSNEV